MRAVASRVSESQYSGIAAAEARAASFECKVIVSILAMKQNLRSARTAHPPTDTSNNPPTYARRDARANLPKTFSARQNPGALLRL